MERPQLTGAPTVLITGASSGIGAACARYLSEQGFRVIGTVRREQDADALRALPGGVIPLLLDVTDHDAVRRLPSMLAEQGVTSLDGLVNNAGIAVAGPVETTSMEGWRKQFDVNVLAQVAVTQALLPLVRDARGCIVMMSSIAGRTSFPFMGPYTSSKFAVEAISDSLRMEVSRFDVRVVIIEPATTSSPFWKRGVKLAEDFQRDDEAASSVAPLYQRGLERMARQAQREEATGISTDEVARVVYRALSTAKPRTRYVVGNLEGKMRARLRHLPDRFRDSLIKSVLKL